MQLRTGYFWLFLIALTWSCQQQPPVDFATQVKPILNKECIICHGGVKKQGNFSVLFREEALGQLKSGAYGIVPGHPESSEMILRLTSTDPEERMPYEHDALPQEQIDLLTRWIKEGAQWGEHWAYQSIREVTPPMPSDDWVTNDIDRFILKAAKEQGLQVSPQADPATLARRVSLDLIGYPDEGAATVRYLADPSEANYQAMVDSLLASPHYGEKWTSMWLDLARYADTKGYERDDSRDIWRYRDWLIRAFNADKPYDQFITEQIAGDLLPHPSEDQYIATAFHRNTMTNDEGGTDNEEFRVAAVLDRVNTTWEALLGTTFACVQCHSHPYDPFRHEDYYRFMAFFNDTRDEDTYDDYPRLRHFDSLQTAQYQQLNQWMDTHVSETQKQAIDHFVKTWQPAYNSLRCDDFSNAELSDTKWLAMRNHSSARLSHVYLGNNEKLVLRVVLHRPGGIWRIHLDQPDGPVIGTLNLNAFQGKRGWIIHEMPIKPVEGHHDLYFTYDNASLQDPLATGVRFDWFYFTNAFPGNHQPGYQEARDEYWSLVNAPVETTPILMDNPPPMHRVTRIFERGSWLSLGDTVSPGTPASLNPFPEGAPANRLGLARWMTDPENPLLARTLVNRLWEQLFGFGLVETLEDLGSQGAACSHPALLEYLSWQFIHDDAWSMKKLLRTIVLSSTYRQDSHISEPQLAADPKNKFLARGPRLRLTAEQIRDQALARCGVLNPEMYGPPVMPYQPEGIWNSPYSGLKWNKSKNKEQYRRALYTYWKRTAPYPSMIAFDGVGREVCSARRIVTNTPLQALVTLNDSVYLDLSRKLADRAAQDTPDKTKKVSNAYTIMTGQPISQASLTALVALFEQGKAAYELDPELTRHMCGTVEPDSDYASLVLVANAILNLDEVITKKLIRMSHLKHKLFQEAQHAVLMQRTRRTFLHDSMLGLGSLALGSLLPGCHSGTKANLFDPANPLAPKLPQFAGKAKSVIYLHMAGAPSQLELFDYKPELFKLDGLDCPPSFLEGKKFAFIRGVPKMLAPQAKFAQYGESGTWLSENLPHLSNTVDDLAFLKAVSTDQFNHAPAQLLMQTGSARLGRPSMGSWVTYGLGTENNDLPAFVVLTSGGNNPDAGKSIWGSGFLPSVYQGVQCRSEGDPVLFLDDPDGITRDLRKASIEAINKVNQSSFDEYGDPETLSRISQYEMAYRMQISVPEVMDISKEPEYIHTMYGTEPGKASFANNVLLARKLVEKGVRFVQLYDWGWDMHGTGMNESVDFGLKRKCELTDQPVAALLMDLKQRGLLDQTLVVWGGEFGRTPMAENREGKANPFKGRDHHGDAFTMWMAGGGIKGGSSYGETDEFGYEPIAGKVNPHDIQATILRLLGFDHEKLTYDFQGRPFRLTDVEGKVIEAVVA